MEIESNKTWMVKKKLNVRSYKLNLIFKNNKVVTIWKYKTSLFHLIFNYKREDGPEEILSLYQKLNAYIGINYDIVWKIE